MRLVAVSWRGEFFAQDPADGFLVPVGHTGFTRINSLTVTPDDRVLCIAGREDANPVVVEINPATGRGTVVCDLDAMVDVRALAAAPTGMLYASIARPDDKYRNSIIEIDPVTGHVAVLRQHKCIGIQSLEFCPHGDLFAYLNAYTEGGTGEVRPAWILRVNTTDWTLRRVSPCPDHPDAQSLAFDECDVGHIAMHENKMTHRGATPILRTRVDADARSIIIEDAAFAPRGVDIRGIGFLGAHRACEPTSTNHLAETTHPQATEEPTQ